MGRLTSADLRALLDLVGTLYAFRDLDAFRREVISEVRAVIPAEVIGWSEMWPSQTNSANWFSPEEINDPSRDRNWHRHMHEHPVLTQFLRTGNGSACKISDFLTRRQFHDLGLYSDVYRSMRVEEQMGILLPLSPPPVVGLALHRERVNFSERDRLLLNLLRPHVTQAYCNAKAVSQIHEELCLAAGALRDLHSGLVVLTADKVPRFVSRQASRWIAEYFKCGLQEGAPLPEIFQRWLEHQEGLFRRIDDAPGQPKPLVAERDGGRLIISLLHDADHSALLLTEHRMAVRPEAIEQLGLTRREAEVLAWVAEGKTNEEVGILIGVRPRTVAKHLEHIFPKLGVETRTAAAARALACLSGAEPAPRAT